MVRDDYRYFVSWFFFRCGRCVFTDMRFLENLFFFSPPSSTAAGKEEKYIPGKEQPMRHDEKLILLFFNLQLCFLLDVLNSAGSDLQP
jgi:hypothetical protein